MDTREFRCPTAAGRAAEQRALNELLGAGLQLVARNFGTRLGEIDLIMRDGAVLVFVEVRFRTSSRHGGAAPSVTRSKRRRLQAAAAVFLARNPRLATLPARFDVVAFDGDDGPGHWIRNAFA